MRTLGLALFCTFALSAAEDLVVFHNTAESPRAQLAAYLNAIGRNQLQQRKAKINAIKTREGAAQRQQIVRQQILALIGGLPNYHGPLNARTAGTLNHADYRLEKVIYCVFRMNTADRAE